MDRALARTERLLSQLQPSNEASLSLEYTSGIEMSHVVKSPAVAQALANNLPIVALESTGSHRIHIESILTCSDLTWSALPT